jgi:threonine dehydrogenase-like Zn-dependent dehydrogenase
MQKATTTEELQTAIGEHIAQTKGYVDSLGQVFEIIEKKTTGKKCKADKLLEYVVQGKVKLDDVITHRLPLSEIAPGYSIFKKKEDNCAKVVQDPWSN